MKTLNKNLALLLVLLLAVTVSTAGLTGCSSSNAATKKGGSKKSKKDKQAEESDHAEEAKSEEKDTAKDDHDAKDEKESKKDSPKSGEEKGSSASADKIWSDLMKGNKQFVAGKSQPPIMIEERRKLAKGQHPDVIVLGCADSRVPPELIFEKNLGELFTIRAAGNVADSVMLGSIEYAVEHLHSKVLLILGHDGCGAVAAAVSGAKMPTPNLEAIVNKIVPAFEGSKSCPVGGKPGSACVELNVEQSAKAVMAKSPVIKKEVEAGKLTIIKAVYNMETGEVRRLD